MCVVLQPYEALHFLLGALIRFLMGAPEWVPQTSGSGQSDPEPPLGECELPSQPQIKPRGIESAQSSSTSGGYWAKNVSRSLELGMELHLRWHAIRLTNGRHQRRRSLPSAACPG
jgi:hypothetical protein